MFRKTLLSDPKRLWTHLALFALTLVGIWAVYALHPAGRVIRFWTKATGDVSMVQIAATLIVGPLNLVWQRRNPVNIYLRRDIGIWAGLTGIVHVILGVASEDWNVMDFFLKHGYKQGIIEINTNLTGVFNYAGLFATIVLVLLFLISNDLSLRWLKGGRWKTLQRLNYGLLAFTVLHGLGYQLLFRREFPLIYLYVEGTILVVGMQGLGIILSLHRRGFASSGVPQAGGGPGGSTPVPPAP